MGGKLYYFSLKMSHTTQHIIESQHTGAKNSESIYKAVVIIIKQRVKSPGFSDSLHY